MRIDLRSGPGGGVSVPPAHLISDERIVAALRAYRAARIQRDAAHDQAFRFERERQSALEADATALADALDAGSEDAGSTSVQDFDAKLVELKRRAEALDLLAARRLGELREAFEDIGAWAEQLEQLREQRRVAWQEGIDRLETAHAALAEAEALITFCRTGSYWPPAPPEVIPPGGDVTLGQALAILRAHGRPARAEVVESLGSAA